MGTNDGAVDHLDFPIHMASMVGTFLDTGEYLGPDPLLLPAVEPGTHRFPVAIAFGKVAPCASRALDPEDAIQDGPVIQGRPTRARSLWWEQWSQLAPLLVCQFITSNHTSFYRVEGGLQTQPRAGMGRRGVQAVFSRQFHNRRSRMKRTLCLAARA